MHPHDKPQENWSQRSKLTLPSLTNALLFGNSTFTEKILDVNIEYILSSNIFDEYLF